MSMNPLEPIREEIDKLDQQLIELLAQRLTLVAEVGKIKHQYGLPIYAPTPSAGHDLDAHRDTPNPPAIISGGQAQAHDDAGTAAKACV